LFCFTGESGAPIFSKLIACGYVEREIRIHPCAEAGFSEFGARPNIELGRIGNAYHVPVWEKNGFAASFGSGRPQMLRSISWATLNRLETAASKSL